MLSETDRFLINAVREGNYSAFETLFKSYYTYLFQVARVYLKSEEDAQDLIQDFFVKIWEQPALLDVKTSLKGYLHASIYNACINNVLRQYHKTRKINDTVLNDLTNILRAPDTDLPETNLLAAEMENVIGSAIDKLPQECNKIFHMSRFEELSHREIAERLNISENTVKVQIYRALLKIKNAIAESD